MAAVDTPGGKPPLWISSTPEHDPVTESGRHTPLEIFQILVGLNTPSSLRHDGLDAGRSRTDNAGLYQRVQEQERASRIAYLCTSFICNFLYILQIFLAATFTAVSAYKESNPITCIVLGAFNTVVAG